MFQRAPDRLQELQQRPGALRELEAIQQLVADAARVAADHVAHVQLGHLVVGHVGDRVARRAQRAVTAVPLRAAVREREADEDLRAARRRRSGS